MALKIHTGKNAHSTRKNHQEAVKRAEQLRPVFTEIAHLSTRHAAAELNRRGVPTVDGGHWHAETVRRIRLRLFTQRNKRHVNYPSP